MLMLIKPSSFQENNGYNFNTSHVNVNRSRVIMKGDSLWHFNTSHVNVNQHPEVF